MWAIRVLSGPQAGQIFKLKNGRNTLGRSENSNIRLQSNGVSKEHLEIHVYATKLIFSDLKSSNGTFLNGVRVNSAIIMAGDKLSAHDVLFEVIAAPQEQPVLFNSQKITPILAPQSFQAIELNPAPAAKVQETAPTNAVNQYWLRYQNYVHEVLLPGVYRLAEVFEYRMVLLGFAVIFILVVTVLSIFPMKQITSESIHTESRRRAQTVARALANANEKVIRMGDYSNFSTDFVLREDGIEDVYIVSKDGMLLAPPERVGSRPRETGFVKQILGQTREMSSSVGSGQVAAAYPIVAFDAELQKNVPKAYAVVVFNVSSLQFDDGRAFSLFMQMLIIASLVGSILFYFIFKLVELPLVRLNKELDLALRENRDHTTVILKLPALQSLIVNINSLLARALHPTISTLPVISQNRDFEMINLVQLIGYPCLIVSRAKFIISMNSGFESLTGISASSIMNQSLQSLPDQALQKNMLELTLQSEAKNQQICSDQIEISGHPLMIHCQALLGSQGEVEYYLLTMTPKEQVEGGAA